MGERVGKEPGGRVDDIIPWRMREGERRQNKKRKRKETETGRNKRLG